MQAAPPAEVVAAFGGEGVPIRLEGGQGTSWRAGGIVLKPAGADGDALPRWLDGTARPALAVTDLRIALPVATGDGSLRFRGWEATPFLAGTRPKGRWRERADVTRRFSSALAAVDPVGLPVRNDPWARADRAAWGEEAGPLSGHPLGRVLRPLERPIRVVHGDLAGNTLFHEGLPPAVLDLSLYARPVEWAVAVLTVDVLAFEAAPHSLVRAMSEDLEFPQLLARALLFRMTTDVLLGAEPDRAYSPIVDLLLQLLG